MTNQPIDVDEIAARHEPCCSGDPLEPGRKATTHDAHVFDSCDHWEPRWCRECGHEWPCDAAKLAGEVRRLWELAETWHTRYEAQKSAADFAELGARKAEAALADAQARIRADADAAHDLQARLTDARTIIGALQGYDRRSVGRGIEFVLAAGEKSPVTAAWRRWSERKP